ncbi:hypothetical protein Moror_8544 [Moniliophthora roreri MCA 2997]|uniref:Uncharacterized protein n=1 Tax=Moniliophthora roreri (strain MCA 2997) TaxID=1381753 RepID=V2WQG4_MONRO|nr:hypothetical protein Moror_8544 [Moniliophthora roreri MCA 2997]
MEYSTFSDDKKAKLVKEFSAIRSTEVVIRTTGGRALAQEASNHLSNAVGILKAMSLRVGVEAISLVTRNRPEPFMGPYWFFTNRAYADYLALIAKGGFNFGRVGEMMQAFSIAKCDVTNLSSTVNGKLRAIRSSIRETLRTQAEECKRKRGTLEEGKEVKGWPFEEIKNLSALSSSLTVLNDLRTKLANGTCKLRLLSDEEWEKFRADYDRRQENGELDEPPRKERADAHQKRGPKKKSSKKKRGVVVEIGGVGLENGDGTGDADDGQGSEDEEDVGLNVKKVQKPATTKKGASSKEDGRDDEAIAPPPPTNTDPAVSPSNKTPLSAPSLGFIPHRWPGAEPPFEDDPPARPPPNAPIESFPRPAARAIDCWPTTPPPRADLETPYTSFDYPTPLPSNNPERPSFRPSPVIDPILLGEAGMGVPNNVGQGKKRPSPDEDTSLAKRRVARVHRGRPAPRFC